MLLLKAWLLLPALLALLSLGWGLLVERVSAARLPGALIVPSGLAAIIVAARAAMTWDGTAGLATPIVAVGAFVGLALGRARLRGRDLDGWAVAATVAVFGVFAAPVVLSGSATFAGYSVLGDTAVHFVLADWIASEGTSLQGLNPSSYRQTLEAYFGSGYPLGADAGLAAVRPLALLDVAWAFQPFLAFNAAALALSLAGLLPGVVQRGWRTAGVVVLAAQSALVYAFAMQGSIKELVTLWIVALLAALIAALAALPARASQAERFRYRLRHLVPLAVAAAAGVAATGVAVAAWLGPLLLVGLWIVARRRPRRLLRTGAIALGFCGLLVSLCLPTLLDLGEYLNVTHGVLTSENELGNLFYGPLHLTQVFGVWLTGDYRVLPTAGPELWGTNALISVAAVAALVGLIWLARRRALAPLLFLAISLIALWYVTQTGSPWADAKALAIASPAVLLTAALGAIALEALGARLQALAVAGALALGVLGSNAFIYHDVSLAPRARLAELAEVGERTAGRGPLLYTGFDETAKHFLRDSDPVGAAEALIVPGLTPLTPNGSAPSFGHPVELSALLPEDVQRFSLLLVRRSPLRVRPPGYSLEWSGRYYELWARRVGGRRPVVYQALRGNGAESDCRLVHRVASGIPRRGRLVANPAPPLVELRTAELELPPDWSRRPDSRSLVETVGPGVVTGPVVLRRSGPYEVWLRGSFGSEVEVRIDGQPAGTASDELAQPADWLELGSRPLEAGAHTVELARGEGSLAPGDGDGPRTLGPLILRRRDDGADQVTVPAGEWQRLCGRRLLAVSALVGES